DVESRLAFETVGELWEGAAAATGDPSLGVHVAEALPKGSLDIIEYLGAGSCTLGEAYQRIAHYIRLYFDGSDVRLIVEPRRARIVRRSVEPFAQYTEFITT